MLDHLIQWVTEPKNAVSDDGLLGREEDCVFLEEPQDVELSGHEAFPRPDDGEFVLVAEDFVPAVGPLDGVLHVGGVGVRGVGRAGPPAGRWPVRHDSSHTRLPHVRCHC